MASSLGFSSQYIPGNFSLSTEGNPISAVITLPQYLGPSLKNIPTLGAPKAIVISALIATCSTTPVSQFNPEGRSIDTTLVSALLTQVKIGMISSRTVPLKPIPKTQSIIKSALIVSSILPP